MNSAALRNRGSTARFAFALVLALAVALTARGESDEVSSREAKLFRDRVVFSPTKVIVQRSYTGVKQIHIVDVINPSDVEDLLVTDVDCSTRDLLLSSFPPLTLVPGERTRIHLTVIPRTPGNATHYLRVRTSIGLFRIPVEVHAKPNPYGIVAAAAFQAPIGTTIEVPLMTTGSTSAVGRHQILAVNGPTMNGLRVHMVNVSMAQQYQGAYAMLEFTASETGTIAAEFVVQTAAEAVHVLVKIHTVNAGLLVEPEDLNFGTITSIQQVANRTLTLTNAALHEISIVGLRPVTKDPVLQIREQYHGIIYPGERVVVANFQYDGRIEGLYRGDIVVSTSARPLRIPYRVNVMHGKLDTDPPRLAIYSSPRHGANHSASLPVRVTSSFKRTLVIDRVQGGSGLVVSSPAIMETLEPGAPLPLCRISIARAAWGEQIATHIHISANETALRIPVQVFNGRLGVRVSSLAGRPGNHADFGVVRIREARAITIALRNDNPVPVSISSISSDNKRVLWCVGGDAAAGKAQRGRGHAPCADDGSASPLPVQLAPQSTTDVVLELNATSADVGAGWIRIRTNHELISVRVRYRIAPGSISPEPSSLDMGKVCMHRTTVKLLALRNDFEHDVRVRGSLTSDRRVRVRVRDPLLAPGLSPHAIEVSLNPTWHPDLPAVLRELAPRAPGAPRIITPADLQRMKALRQALEAGATKGLFSIRSSVTLRTDAVQRLDVPVSARVIVPRVVQNASIALSLTQLRAEREAFVTACNPFEVPLAVFPLPFLDPSSEYTADQIARIEEAHAHMLRSPSAPFGVCCSSEQAARVRTRPLSRQQRCRCAFRVPMHDPAARERILAPDECARIGPIRFRPLSLGESHAVLYIYNNLTVLEAVDVSGDGATGNLTVEVDGRPRASLSMVLADEFAARVKSDVEAGAFFSRASLPWVQRTFHIMNSGRMPVAIYNVGVNGAQRQAYGFNVVGASEMLLQPGDSVPVHLKYQSDAVGVNFTRHVHIVSSLGLLKVPVRVIIQPMALKAMQRALAAAGMAQNGRVLPLGAALFVAVLVTIPLINLVRSAAKDDDKPRWLGSDVAACIYEHEARSGASERQAAPPAAPQTDASTRSRLPANVRAKIQRMRNAELPAVDRMCVGATLHARGKREVAPVIGALIARVVDAGSETSQENSPAAASNQKSGTAAPSETRDGARPLNVAQSAAAAEPVAKGGRAPSPQPPAATRAAAKTPPPPKQRGAPAPVRQPQRPSATKAPSEKKPRAAETGVERAAAQRDGTAPPGRNQGGKGGSRAKEAVPASSPAPESSPLRCERSKGGAGRPVAKQPKAGKPAAKAAVKKSPLSEKGRGAPQSPSAAPVAKPAARGAEPAKKDVLAASSGKRTGPLHVAAKPPVREAVESGKQRTRKRPRSESAQPPLPAAAEPQRFVTAHKSDSSGAENRAGQAERLSLDSLPTSPTSELAAQLLGSVADDLRVDSENIPSLERTLSPWTAAGLGEFAQDGNSPPEGSGASRWNERAATGLSESYSAYAESESAHVAQWYSPFSGLDGGVSSLLDIWRSQDQAQAVHEEQFSMYAPSDYSLETETIVGSVQSPSARASDAYAGSPFQDDDSRHPPAPTTAPVPIDRRRAGDEQGASLFSTSPTWITGHSGSRVRRPDRS